MRLLIGRRSGCYALLWPHTSRQLVEKCEATVMHSSHVNPPYSPDLTPSDYILFPNMKKRLAGRHYESDEELIAAMEEFSETKMRASIPQGSKDSSIAGESVWTERETMLKNKSVLAF